MKNKTKISKFFETLIYFILLTLPLISVFARTIYVQANYNAKDSYSDSYVYQNIKIEQSQFNVELQYTAIYNGGSWSTDNTQYNFTYISLTASDLGLTQDVYDTLSRWNWLSTNRIQLRNSSGFLLATIIFDASHVRQFNFIGNISTQFFNGANLYQVVLMDNKLDNAFEYGLQKTIDDFGTGNINFLNWFGTMFSNNTNLLYINFVNMYLNYALWVSVGYLLYYFLNWFIRFVRETLDRLIYKESNQ